MHSSNLEMFMTPNIAFTSLYIVNERIGNRAPPLIAASEMQAVLRGIIVAANFRPNELHLRCIFSSNGDAHVLPHQFRSFA